MSSGVSATEAIFRGVAGCMILTGLLILAIGLDPTGFYSGWWYE